ncbi:NAD/FAD-utilizing enzyme [Gammaproteobacteria bacterium 53_120_T64]|nr:NAD/FAD-utilizing enzyme [Gammaproteobacteria bacterium 53_120_T64]
MKRHYFVSDDLDDLEHVEEELERDGLVTPQIHVLSNDDAGVAHHPHLHEVEAVMRTDVVRSMKIGAVVGLIAAPLVLVIAHYFGYAEQYTWVPFIFLSIVVLGFCTWEGGFLGIQVPHHQFKQFKADLDAGRHVFFVDVNLEQKAILDGVVGTHPGLHYGGEAKATAGWFVSGNQKMREFMKAMP